MFNYENIGNDIYYFKLYNIKQNEYDHFIYNFNSLFNKKKNLKIIFDLSDVSIQDFLYSKQILNFMKENKEKTKKYIDKTAIIIPNDFIRKNINFCIFNFYEPLRPNEITDTIENAIDFLNK